MLTLGSHSPSRYLLYHHVVIGIWFMSPIRQQFQMVRQTFCAKKNLNAIILICFFFFRFLSSVIRIPSLNMSDHCPKSTPRSAMMRCLISILNHQMTFACQIIAFWLITMAAVAANVAVWCLARIANRVVWFQAPDAIYRSINDRWHDIYQSCPPIWTFGYTSKVPAIKSHSAHMLLSIRSAVAGKALTIFFSFNFSPLCNHFI